MRKHLHLITNHPDEDYIGLVEFRDHPVPTVEKNKEGVVKKRNIETGEGYAIRAVGMGYVDFEDEADYEENALPAIKEKLAEIDVEHLENAGLDPETALA
jgi:hypothetical protein